MNFMYFFRIFNINFQKISFITFFVITFYEIFIKLGSILHSLKIIYYFCFSYGGNWELVKTVFGISFKRSHVCLHSQVRIEILYDCNDFTLYLYVIKISVKKLIQVLKSNTVGFIRIQRHSSKILKIVLKGQPK